MIGAAFFLFFSVSKDIPQTFVKKKYWPFSATLSNGLDIMCVSGLGQALAVCVILW